MVSSPTPTLSAVNHLIFGLTSNGNYDVNQNGQMIAYDLPAGPAGSIVFPTEGGGTFSVLPTGLVDPPPSRVTTLAAGSPGTTTVLLSWIAVGADGNQGRASEYDIRYSTSPIDGGSWADADRVTGEPSPRPAGETETFTVSGLAPATRYYFAIKVADQVPNWSLLSNVASSSTESARDSQPPSGISDIEGIPAGHHSVSLSWTAPHDDTPSESVTSYIGRFSPNGLTEETWEEGLILEGLPEPGEPGHAETFLVEGLAPATTYAFGIRALDEEGNISSLSSVCRITTTSATDTLPPERITDLSLGMLDRTSIEVTWSAPADQVPDDCVEAPEVDRYEARFSTLPLEGDGWAAGVPVSAPDPGAPGSPQQLAIHDLLPSTRYFVAVRSCDSRGNWSETSNQVDATTLAPEVLPDVTPPARIEDLAARAAGPDQVVLTWISPSDARTPGGADHYDIRRAQLAVTPETWEAATPILPAIPCREAGAPETLGVSGLEPATTHHFAIRAIDAAGNLGPLSESVDAITPSLPDTLAPSPIIDLQVAAVDTISVLLAWTTPPDDRGSCGAYEMRMSREEIGEDTWAEGDSVPGLPAPGSPGTPASHQITGLAPATRYYFALRAVDPAGNWSSLSNVVEASTDSLPGPPVEEPGDTTPPAVVRDLTASPIDETRILLSWHAVGDDGLEGQAHAYELRRSGEAIDEGTWESAIPVDLPLAPSAAGSVETFTVTGLEADTEHHFAIRVSDEAGNRSGCSNDAMARTPIPLDTSPPAAPLGLSAIDEIDRVRLAWFPSPEPDVADYTLYRRVTGSDEVWTVPGLVSPSFLDTTALPAIEYSYFVAARDASGNLSAPSSEVSIALEMEGFLPQLTGFHAAARVRMENNGQTPVVRLTWRSTEMVRVAGFAIERSDDGGTSWMRRTGDLLPPQQQSEFAEPMERPSCLYRVVAVSARGFELAMPPVSAVLADRVRRHRIDGPFPNPSVGPLRFHFHLESPTHVRILAHDVTGRVRTVLRDEDVPAGEQDWSLSDAAGGETTLSSGVYFLSIEAGEERSSRKLILQR